MRVMPMAICARELAGSYTIDVLSSINHSIPVLVCCQKVGIRHSIARMSIVGGWMRATPMAISARELAGSYTIDVLSSINHSIPVLVCCQKVGIRHSITRTSIVGGWMRVMLIAISARELAGTYTIDVLISINHSIPVLVCRQ